MYIGTNQSANLFQKANSLRITPKKFYTQKRNAATYDPGTTDQKPTSAKGPRAGSSTRQATTDSRARTVSKTTMDFYPELKLYLISSMFIACTNKG